MQKARYAAALALLMVLGGCATTDKCGPGGCSGDEQITSNVQNRLNRRPELGTQVYVQTLDRVVYLTGTVSASEMSREAESVAGGVPGVTRVVNTIAVSH